MQRITQFIQLALIKQGIATIIYQVDILTISRNNDDPERKFATILQLLEELGLPVAWEKVMSPARVVKFLGIIIDADKREVRIPQDKMCHFAQLADESGKKQYISMRAAQSIAGHINHTSKGV